MTPRELHDVHEQPPGLMRALFKRWQKSSVQQIEESVDVLDLNRSDCLDRVTRFAPFLGREGEIQHSVHSFIADGAHHEFQPPITVAVPSEAFEIKALPGLLFFPSLLSGETQLALLDRLLHRDLSNPQHQTNMHLFHLMNYPARTTSEGMQSQSFFAMNLEHQLQPKNYAMHKPMTISRMLQRKLRWMTLGGQYDWTSKVYPDEPHPNFPSDIAQLLRAVFPNVEAQAAIVNLYTPGDTLSVHRDVSEQSDRDLISISLGCDGIFLVGNADGSSHATLRLRSGDALLMTGESRFAWHSVPKVLPDTCPDWLKSWPAGQHETRYEHWRGWMETKRINLNVRQMRDPD